MSVKCNNSYNASVMGVGLDRMGWHLGPDLDSGLPVGDLGGNH